MRCGRTPDNGRRGLTPPDTHFSKRPAPNRDKIDPNFETAGSLCPDRNPVSEYSEVPNPDISTSSAPGIEVDVSKPLEFEHLFIIL